MRPLVLDAAELETAEQYVLNVAIQGWSDKYPTVSVTTRLNVGDARHALVEASGGAQLVVARVRRVRRRWVRVGRTCGRSRSALAGWIENGESDPRRQSGRWFSW